VKLWADLFRIEYKKEIEKFIQSTVKQILF
jgi:hypothetical protein